MNAASNLIASIAKLIVALLFAYIVTKGFVLSRQPNDVGGMNTFVMIR
jgi:hypothetical protein